MGLLRVADRAGQHRSVGMLRALGIGRRARRVEDPAHRILGRVVVDRGRGGQCRRVAFGVEVIRDERVHVVVLTCNLLGQRLVVELVPGRRRDQELALRLLRDERHLAVAVDGEHRILDRAEPAQRSDQHGRFRPRGELPGDVRSRRHAERVQSRRRALAQVAILHERRRAIAVVQHHPIGSGSRPPFDELPDAARVVDHRSGTSRGHTVMPPSIETMEPVM